MKKTIAAVAAMLVLAPLPVFAQDEAKAKALAQEKALLEAQAARDNAEAAAIKAAADLAKAKAGAADAETAALQSKTARDQAETAALTATKALADAKNAANSIDIQAQKSQLDASAALSASKVADQTAELTALKGVFGAAPTIGADGNVTITDSTTGMLLETKSGSLKATGTLAIKLCDVLKERNISNAYIAPPDLDKKVLASNLMLREFRALTAVATKTENKDLVGGSVQAQLAPAAVLGAVSLLQYGAGAVQSIAKLFRSDYSISLADGKRETWLEYFMAANCPLQLPRADIEASVRAMGMEVELKQLNDLAEFVDRANTQKALQTRKLETAKAAIKERTDAKQPPTQGDLQNQTDAQQVIDKLAMLDGPLARMKTFIDVVATKPDTFIDAVVWDRFAADAYKKRPRITVAFTTQDGQVAKTHWLTGKHIYGRSSGELIYRVVQSDGAVLMAGYLVATNSEGQLDFAVTAAPKADGLRFPLQVPTVNSPPQAEGQNSLPKP